MNSNSNDVLSQSTLETLASSLFVSAERILCEDLCFMPSSVLTAFKPFRLADDQHNITPGHSIAALPHSSLIRAGAFHDIRVNLSSHPRTTATADAPTPSREWTKPQKEAYSSSITEFLELLLVLLLLKGKQPDQGAKYGQPAELLSLIHRNPSVEELRAHPKRRGVVRSIFLSHGRVVIMTADHRSVAGVRIRRLDERATRLLVLYLTSVRPFFQQMASEDTLAVSECLFETKEGLWTTERYREVLARESQERIGRALSIEDVNEVFEKKN